MNRQLRNVSLALMAVTVLIQVGACGRAQKPEPPADGMAVASHAASEVSWTQQWDTAFARARSEHKVVLVDFYADWCIWCKRLDSTTYRDPRVVSFLAANTVPLKLDVEGNGREEADRYRVDGLPTIMILSPGGEVLGRIPGYLPADAFLERVEGIVSTGRTS